MRRGHERVKLNIPFVTTYEGEEVMSHNEPIASEALFIYLLPEKHKCMFGNQSLVHKKSTRGPPVNGTLPFYVSCVPKPYLMTVAVDMQ